MKMNKLTLATLQVLALTLTTTGLIAAEADATKPKGPAAKGVDSTVVGEETAVLAQGPQVPPPLKRTHATKVIVKLEVREVVKKMADGVERSAAISSSVTWQPGSAS